MTKTIADRRRNLRLALALTGLSLALGACTTTARSSPPAVPTTIASVIRSRSGSQPVDRGLRRPGARRPLAAQRADVVGLARNWHREGTGAVVVDVPVDTPNARAAAATYREIRSVLAAGGVPSRAITSTPIIPTIPACWRRSS